MLSWAQQKRALFIGWVSLFLIVVLGIYALVSVVTGPSCENGKRDGAERGIDCGGDCLRVCVADTTPLLVHFVRALEVEEGVWAAVAYGENRNKEAGARDVPYVVKLYDDNNLLIYERHGNAFIPPRKIFAVFEGRMRTGSRAPTRATFEFTREPVFERLTEPKLLVTTRDFTSDTHGSELRVHIRNVSRTPVDGIEATALLFDTDGTVFAASATALKRLQAEGDAMLVFTWPTELPGPARIEVFYTVPGLNNR